MRQSSCSTWHLLLSWQVLLVHHVTIAEDGCPEACLCVQTMTPGGTTVNCTDRQLTEFPTNLPTNIVHLELSNNHVKCLKTLPSLPQLKALYLNDNDLKIVETRLCNHVPKLKMLDLSSNSLSEIPKCLPMTLEVLHVSDNKIRTVFSEDFTNLVNLEELHLDGNTIRQIDSQSFGANLESIVLPSLNKLALNNNKLKDIDGESFIKLVDLKAITLSNNRLQSLTASMFKGLKRLEFLDINNNNLSKIENSTFKSLSSLKVLYLSQNSLSEVPHGLPFLEWLDLSRNRIMFVNETQSNTDIYPIEVVNLAHNPLHCDCHMLWLKELWDRREYILKNSVVIVHEDFVPTCTSPLDIANESWDFLGDDVFRCDESTDNQKKISFKAQKQMNKYLKDEQEIYTSPFGELHGDLDIEQTIDKDEKQSEFQTDDRPAAQLHISVGRIATDSVTIHWRSKHAQSVTWVYVHYYVFGDRSSTTIIAQVALTSGMYVVRNLHQQTNYIICAIPKTSDEIVTNTKLDQCIEARTLVQPEWWASFIPDEKSLTYHIKLIIYCGLISVIIVGIGVFIYEIVIYRYTSMK